ncbi:MAG: N-acyl homoserine lactonase family protein [Chloroflexota bacterium]
MEQPTLTRRSILRMLGLGTLGAIAGGGITQRVTSNWYRALLNAPNNPMQGVQVPVATHTTASGIKIHHIQTGYVAVKTAHREYDGPDGRGIPAIVFDRQWTDWMPISVWVIEHPEGVIVVDTGETERATRSGYHQGGDAFFYGSFLRFALTKEDEVGPQMATLGIPTNEVRWVVQTHLHGDHMGGMGEFTRAEFFVAREDYPQSTGALPYHYPDWLDPRFSNFSTNPIASFQGSQPITKAGDVFIVPTPGHSLGHQSVVLRDGDTHYFFAGDTSFDDIQLLGSITAGIVADPATSRSSLKLIRDYCEMFDTVYLPSHDPESRSRLLTKSFTKV